MKHAFNTQPTCESVCLCLCVVYNVVLFDVADMDDIAMMLITDEQFNFGLVFSPTSSEQE